MDLYNPILIKEMRTRMRGKRAFVVLTIYVTLLSLILVGGYLLTIKTSSAIVINQMGRGLTVALIFVQMGVICLIAPTFSASAITSEREQQTFDLLIASLAKPTTIVFGKVGASLSYLLLTLFGSLPLIALTYSLGGVALGDIAKSYLVMLNAGIAFCALSFLWSTLIRRGVMAQLMSIIAVIFLVAGLPLLTLILTALAGSFNQGPSNTFINVLFLILRTNPFAAIGYLIIGFPMPSNLWIQGVPIWVTQVIFYMLVTALSLYLSLRRLKNVRNWL